MTAINILCRHRAVTIVATPVFARASQAANTALAYVPALGMEHGGGKYLILIAAKAAERVLCKMPITAPNARDYQI